MDRPNYRDFSKYRRDALGAGYVDALELYADHLEARLEEVEKREEAYRNEVWRLEDLYVRKRVFLLVQPVDSTTGAVGGGK